MAQKKRWAARKERKWKSKSVVTAAVVAAAVELAGICNVLMLYLIEYTSN